MANYTYPNIPAAFDAGDTIRFNYNGWAQVLDVSIFGKIKIECYGSAGTSGGNRTGGQGGYAYGILDCQQYASILNGRLYIVSGGMDVPRGAGGFNGGGGADSGPGGGASDVRTFWNDNVGDMTSLQSRLIIGAGGGGADWQGGKNGPGGHGGGWIGNPGNGANGGTQTAGGWGRDARGAYWKGGSHYDYSGGGGGGLYGGGCSDGAAGGSSYVSGNPNCPYQNPYGIVLTDSDSIVGGNTGTGFVVITIIEPGYKKYYKSLSIKKNDGNIQKIPLYEKTESLKQPLLAVNDNGNIVYARLGNIYDNKASASRIKQNGITYAGLL